MHMLAKLKNWIKDAKIIYKEIILAKGHFKVPFFTRLKMNLRGFTADQYVRYDLKNNDISDYISEFERWKSRRINGRYNVIMDDKLLFPEVFGRYVDVPKNLAWIDKGTVYNLIGGQFTVPNLCSLLAKYKQVVVKPVYAQGSGRGVHLICWTEDGILVNGQKHTWDSLMASLTKLTNYVIVEYVWQHPYSAKLFPKSTNTIRLVSVLDDGQASLINAVHRIGVEASIPVDNGTKGALVAEIDMETGTLGRAKTFYKITSFTKHPETGAPIQNIQIPHWAQVKEKVLAVAQNFPYIPFMAWDIVITRDGFMVIEVNTSSGVNLFQMWRGERRGPLGEFYRRHGIIK